MLSDPGKTVAEAYGVLRPRADPTRRARMRGDGPSTLVRRQDPLHREDGEHGDGRRGPGEEARRVEGEEEVAGTSHELHAVADAACKFLRFAADPVISDHVVDPIARYGSGLLSAAVGGHQDQGRLSLHRRRTRPPFRPHRPDSNTPTSAASESTLISAAKSDRARGTSHRASLCVVWPALQRQIRIDGPMRRSCTEEEADRYFASRPRESQIGAWASRQSETLASRDVLEQDVKDVEQRFSGQPIPRPPFWSGYCLVPARIEFWEGKARPAAPSRSHCHDTTWTTRLLYP